MLGAGSASCTVFLERDRPAVSVRSQSRSQAPRWDLQTGDLAPLDLNFLIYKMSYYRNLMYGVAVRVKGVRTGQILRMAGVTQDAEGQLALTTIVTLYLYGVTPWSTVMEYRVEYVHGVLP